MAQTSDHIKPCNIGSSEAHNRRTPEYLKHIGKEKFYIRTDLTPQNSSWVSPHSVGILSFWPTMMTEVFSPFSFTISV